MTAFYMFRLVNMTFFGKSRVDHEVEHHIHESPSSMTMPLMILAGLSIIGGWIGWPESLGGSDRFAKFLAPVMAKHAEEGGRSGRSDARRASMEYLLMLLSVAIACGGIWLAYRWYIQQPEVPDKIAAASPIPLQVALQQILRGPALRRDVRESRERSGAHAGLVRREFHQRAWRGRLRLGDAHYSSISGIWDSWIVDGLVNLAARIVWLFSWPVRMLQTGRVARYALFMLFGVLIFLGYYLWTSGFRL